MTEIYLPFLLFVVAMVGTPGPANLTLVAIGQSTGFSSGLPFISGAIVSFTLLNTLVAVGLGELMSTSPVAAVTLKWVGAVYIVYLAVKLMRLQVSEKRINHRITAAEGFLIHPLSPKSWAMSVAGFSQFAAFSDNPVVVTVVFVLTFFVNQVFFHSLWCASGAFFLGYFRGRKMRIAITAVLAGLMISATAWALFA